MSLIQNTDFHLIPMFSVLHLTPYLIPLRIDLWFNLSREENVRKFGQRGSKKVGSLVAWAQERHRQEEHFCILHHGCCWQPLWRQFGHRLSSFLSPPTLFWTIYVLQHAVNISCRLYLLSYCLSLWIYAFLKTIPVLLFQFDYQRNRDKCAH